jgi:hypothetical protein
MVAAAPDVPAVQSDAVEQSAPSYPASHVQVQLPVVPPTVPCVSSHAMVFGATAVPGRVQSNASHVVPSPL